MSEGQKQQPACFYNRVWGAAGKRGTMARNKGIKISVALEENEVDKIITDGHDIYSKILGT